MKCQTKSFTRIELAWVFKPGLVSLNQTSFVWRFFGGYLIADEQRQGVTK